MGDDAGCAARKFPVAPWKNAATWDQLEPPVEPPADPCLEAPLGADAGRAASRKFPVAPWKNAAAPRWELKGEDGEPALDTSGTRAIEADDAFRTPVRDAAVGVSAGDSDADADGEFLVPEAAVNLETDAAARLTPSPDALEPVVRRISRELYESNVDLLTKVVSNLGVEASLRILAEAHVCISQGGMVVADGSRKRTRAGVFLKLVVDEISPEMKATIWSGEKKKRTKRRQEVEFKKIQEEIEPAWKIPCLRGDRVRADATTIDNNTIST